MEGCDFIVVELGVYLIDFFLFDVMFVIDVVVNFNVEFEDLFVQFFCVGKFIGFVGIEKD